uniref:Uncharacterized protein n=1 Tax=Thermogemmatispora argillosa TaxID=2045280 RepID=A0A455SZ50_9CHLR|nr:hypothetical protein KTA_11490 [Thermogemmatispora argillosa]
MNAGENNTGAYVSPSVCLAKRDQCSSTIIWWIVDLWDRAAARGDNRAGGRDLVRYSRWWRCRKLAL